MKSSFLATAMLPIALLMGSCSEESKQKIEEAKPEVKEAATKVGEAASAIGNDIKMGAKAATEKAVQYYEVAKQKTVEVADDVAVKGKEYYEVAKQKTVEVADDVAVKSKEYYEVAKQKSAEYYEAAAKAVSGEKQAMQTTAQTKAQGHQMMNAVKADHNQHIMDTANTDEASMIMEKTPAEMPAPGQ